MDKKRAIINVLVAIVFKVVILIVSIIARRVIINTIGNELNGLNSLFSSIFSLLSLVELGMSVAVSFSLIKPIVENDYYKINAYYHYFNKLYKKVSILSLLLGSILIFFLPVLAKDYSLDINIYIPYILFLISNSLRYVYLANTTLINAFKNNYLSTIIVSSSLLLIDIMQIISVLIFKNYYLYAVSSIIGTIVEWIVLELVVNKKYKRCIQITSAKLAPSDLELSKKHIKGVFMHKVGSVLVNTTDSIIISAFVGINLLGIYSNYATIALGLSSLLNLLFTSVVSNVSHGFYKLNKESFKKYFYFFHGLNFGVGMVMYLGFYAIINQLVTIFFGPNLLINQLNVMIITINYFIQYLRQSALAFKDASGIFYVDRIKPVVEGVLNLVLSIVFVLLLRDTGYEIIGVIASTIITNLFICHIVEPHILFKYSFESSAKKYYFKNYFYILVFVLTIIMFNFITNFNLENTFLDLLVKGTISVIFSSIISFIVLMLNNEFKYGVISIYKMFKELLSNKKAKSKI
jgi:O-antigen/teichoic acid export membrane protein